MHRIRILHISDLHARGKREDEAFRRQRVLGETWDKNLDELLADGVPIDLLCLTGDVADWGGQPGEYGEATDFLLRTAARCQVPISRVFVVPGNHDISRKTNANVWEKLRAAVKGSDPQVLSRWFASVGEAPLGVEDGWRDAILERQEAYRRWVRDTLERPDLLPSSSTHPRLGYRASLRLDRQPFDVHILGLDTAWLAGDDSDVGNLLLTEDQVMRLATDSGGRRLRGFTLALMHHPLRILADGDARQRDLAGHTHLLLRGHQHDPQLEVSTDPDHLLRTFATGCLYDGHYGNNYPNACLLIDAALDDDGTPRSYDVRFRGWSIRSFWFDDSSLYHKAPNGRLHLDVAPGPSGASPALAPTAVPAVLPSLAPTNREAREAVLPEAITDLVARGNLKEAIDALRVLTKVRKDREDEATTLSGRYYALENREHLGAISDAEARAERTRIGMAIQAILKHLR